MLPQNKISKKMIEKNQAVKTCWIVTDGTTGMLKQSIAVAKSLNLDATILNANATPILRLFPILAKIPTWRLTIGRSPDWIKGPYPDYIISCGKRMAGLSIGLKRISNGRSKTIHIQDPGISPKNFDVLIVPSHDRITKRANEFSNLIISTGSLSWLNKKQIMASKTEMIERFGAFDGPQIVVMLGGHNKRYRISSDCLHNMAKQIIQFASDKNARLIIIPSRRTPKKAKKIFAELDQKTSHIFWSGKQANPYPDVFSIADEIIVTSDSVNMVTEACLLGKPVYISTWGEEQGRIAAFHDMMNAKGYTKPLSQADTQFKPKILNQMPQIAKKINKIIVS